MVMRLLSCLSACLLLAVLPGAVLARLDDGALAAADATVIPQVDASRARLSFGWKSAKIGFRLETRGNKIILHFNRPVMLHWQGTPASLRPYVSHIQSGGDSLSLTLKPSVHVRDLTDYNDNGVELTLSDKPPAPTIIAAKAAPKPAVPRHRAAKVKKKPASQPSARKLPAQMAAPVRPVQETTPPVAQIALPPIPPVPTSAAITLPAVALPAAELAAQNALSVTRLADLSPAAGSADVAETAAPRPAAPPSAHVELPMHEGDPLAVFTRQNMVWIVAGGSVGLSAQTMRATPEKLTSGLQHVTNADAGIFYFPIPEGRYASVSKTPSGTLQVSVENTPPKLETSLIPALKTDVGKHRYLDLPAEKAGRIVAFRDPLTGEAMRVVPLSTLQTGVGSKLDFVEFTLLPSAQGIIIKATADDVSVTQSDDAITISAPKGIALSQEMAKQLETLASQPSASTTLFPYKSWKLEDEKNFVTVQVREFHDIAYSAGDAANRIRLKLLGLYLSEGLFVEAHGMANDILRSSYKFYIDHHVAALRGAAYFFNYRFLEAERDFAFPGLPQTPEVQMWRGLIDELINGAPPTFDFAANYDRFIRYYPPVFIQRLSIIAADRAIARHDYDQANRIFAILNKENLDEPIRKYVDFMRAKELSETHSEEEAAKIWALQAKETDDPLIRARAGFSLINMELRQGRIEVPEAIKRLESLRSVWRGDNLEVSVLSLLGQLYIDQKQYAQALHTLREIVLYFPQLPEAITTARKMEETFIYLYNKGGANSMQPLDALALFYEFRDLVPNGKDGDLMIRNLADRLVSIDLLDRASQLLEHQIQKRLQGEERSRVGAHLALVYLMNHNPKAALDALKVTAYGDLPPDLQLSRLHLTAEALAQQHLSERAINVLANDTSPDGALLKLSVYWDTKDWSNVISTAEDILGNRTDPGAPLTPFESDVLLKLATAYVYEHDAGQIQYLRDYFTPLLKNNANRDSFLFITSESGAIDYENLSNLDKDIVAVKSFLDIFREKIKKNGLSNAI